MAVEPWRKTGGPGWAAMDGQLRSNNAQSVDPFPTLIRNNNNNNNKARSLPRQSPSDAVDHSHSRNINNGRSSSSSSSNPKIHGIPMEPDEWEEEDDGDIYLRYRREALRASRSASRHSEAAAKAFLRGDHDSARRHSLAASRHSSAATSLHSDAAAAISALRNPNSGGDLDLHGLHAPEAIRLLRHRLLNPPPSSSSSSRRLHVITGVGNHSRGPASLPSAVKGFLAENRYYFEETKPGVISVRLKFNGVRECTNKSTEA